MSPVTTLRIPIVCNKVARICTRQNSSKSLGSPRENAHSVDINKFVDKAILNNDVMIFSKTDCPYSSKAKDAFASMGVNCTVYELDNMKDGAQIKSLLKEKTGQKTVPNVFVKGKHIGGFDRTLECIADGTFLKLLNVDSASLKTGCTGTRPFVGVYQKIIS